MTGLGGDARWRDLPAAPGSCAFSVQPHRDAHAPSVASDSVAVLAGTVAPLGRNLRVSQCQ